MHLDPWQQWVLDQACAVREDTYFNDFTGATRNKWAARHVGLVVARQNGKGSILEARELAGLFLFGEYEIVHTAHLAKTSMLHFKRMRRLIERCPDFHREVANYQTSNGKEAIILNNGATLYFATRGAGQIRGASPQLVVCDEAMKGLDAEAMAAVLPSVSAQPNYQFWYTGSAGTKESTEFGRVRNRALAAAPDPYLFFAEWSIDACTDYCPKGCTDHDPVNSVDSYAKANPGLGIRIEVDTVEAERLGMPPEKFLIERLSVGDWPVEGDAWAVIDEEAWTAREESPDRIVLDDDKPLVLAVDTTPDHKNPWSCISACSGLAEGLLVEVTSIEDAEHAYDHRPGTQWVVPRLKQMWDALKPDAVVIDKASQALQFIPQLEEAGITVLSPTSAEYAASCGEFAGGVQPRRGEAADITHLGQEPLTVAVAGADKRDLADKWAWDKRNSQSDISPLVASTLAAWGYRKTLHEKPSVAPWVFRG
ncbi:hypothetical protein [Streptomyces sp. NPDC055085]